MRSSPNDTQRHRYFLNFFVDCTLGVAVVWVAHEAICRAAVARFGADGTALARIGHYGDGGAPLSVWAAQLAAYLAALGANKLLVGGALLAAEVGRDNVSPTDLVS